MGAMADRNYALLRSALYGVHISPAEDASLRALAGNEAATIRRIAAVIARARAARAPMDSLAAPEPVHPATPEAAHAMLQGYLS